MPINEFIIEVSQGEDLTIPFYYFNPDPSGLGNPSSQVPWDLTGAQVRLSVRQTQDPTSQEFLFLSTTTSGIVLSSGTDYPGPALPTNPNGFTVTFTAAQTLAFPIDTLYYDAFIDWPNNTHTLVLGSPFIVYGTVTRAS